ncbi:MAG: acyl-CoA dehydrogenase [Gammaproteobacteria bacterium]|nr:MAG: acyl-CoA dehydrogenase [Gammaproteobacteria bacterium]
MFEFDSIPVPELELGGLEVPLTEEERAVADSVRRFALERMRPLGKQLDRMSADEVAAGKALLLDFLRDYRDLGCGLEFLNELSPRQRARLFPIIHGYLGWGDAGLAILTAAASFPAFAAYQTGNPELIERFGTKIGCWMGTQPDRGSDTVDLQGTELRLGSQHGTPNLAARITDDEIILTGQTSAWVSGGPIAECGLAYVPADYGSGLRRSNGLLNGAVILVPFDEKGVSKGRPVEKLGQRPLPQGAIFFDEVRLPRNYLLANNERIDGHFFTSFVFANMEMACVFSGLARAAFQSALEYVHQRRQGGGHLIEHQNVRHRIFQLWRKVESARAIAQRACDFNFLGKPHVLASATAKIVATELACEVAQDALSLFGGNGLTKEYPMEKYLRDARASLIEDGENNILGLVCAGHISNWFRQHGTEVK